MTWGWSQQAVTYLPSITTPLTPPCSLPHNVLLHTEEGPCRNVSVQKMKSGFMHSAASLLLIQCTVKLFGKSLYQSACL